MKEKSSTPAWVAPALMSGYVLIILMPLAVVALVRPLTDHGFVYTIGKNLGMVGFTILAMQFVLSARLRWIERPFGLNILFHFHKAMAVLAVVFLIAHPVLMCADHSDWSLIFGPEISWHIWLGRIALLILVTHILLASLRSAIRLNYQTWRFVHNLGAVLILPLGFFHSWMAGGDLQNLWLKALWMVLLVSAASMWLWQRVLRTALLRQTPYKVTEVREEAEGVWSIVMEPPPHSRRFDYLPGQFHFLTFQRAPHLPVEEHHWTISSSPSDEKVLCSTIKESGDFTASIGKTKPGDTVLVHGPFGRFSYVLHPAERDLVFIAGGIGITPLMSMLRQIRDTRAGVKVTLLYCNQNERSIAFHKELDAMTATEGLAIKVIHILSKPSDDWPGERGHLDGKMIQHLCGPNLKEKGFYVCAPPEMMNQTVKFLRKAGVPPARIHFERFQL